MTQIDSVVPDWIRAFPLASLLARAALRAPAALATAVLALCIASPGAHAEEVARYDASLGGIPTDSPCWEFVNAASAPPPINNGTALILGPTTNGGTPYWRQSLVPFSFDDGASVAASVKVDFSSYYASFPYKRAGYYIALQDRLGRYAYLGITSDGVLLATLDQNWSNQTYSLNTTNAFHEYRLTFNGSTVVASVDGQPVLTDAVGASTPNASEVDFGDLSVLANSTTRTAWVVVEGVPDCTAGDLNCDGMVDGADLGLLLSAWNTGVCAADLNHDGVVNGGDLGILLGNWG